MALLPHYGFDILSNVEVLILLVSADDYSEVKLITNLTKTETLGNKGIYAFKSLNDYWGKSHLLCRLRVRRSSD